MALEVRDAESRDVPSLRIVKQQAVEDVFSGRVDRSEYADEVAAQDHGLRERIQDPDHEVLVAETNVTTVGFLIFDGDDGEITSVYVAPNHQGKGAGTKLIEKLDERTDVDDLVVEAPEVSAGFFEKVGFDEVNDTEEEKEPGDRTEEEKERSGKGERDKGSSGNKDISYVWMTRN
ncbi:MAG: GNAT family N-acetyltransferase [Halobacteria archaeon]